MKNRRIRALPFMQRGSLVTLRPVQCERGNLPTRGVLAVVLTCSESRTITCACEFGIIGTGNKARPISADFYIHNKNSTSCFGEIGKVRSSILAGTFQEKSTPYIGLGQAHEKIYGGRSGRRCCHCNPSRGCLASCGCIKRKLPCTSGCSCNGACSYTLHYDYKEH